MSEGQITPIGALWRKEYKFDAYFAANTEYQIMARAIGIPDEECWTEDVLLGNTLVEWWGDYYGVFDELPQVKSKHIFELRAKTLPELEEALVKIRDVAPDLQEISYETFVLWKKVYDEKCGRPMLRSPERLVIYMEPTKFEVPTLENFQKMVEEDL